MPATRPASRIAIRSLRAQLVLLLLWGLLMWLSFPRPNMHVLAHLALVPLILVALRGEPQRRVMLLVLVAGSVWWWAMTTWLIPVTLAGHAVLSVYLGAYVLAFVASLRLVHTRLRLPLIVTVPVLWVALEYLRGLIMTGFPWFLLGHSQPTVMIQSADLVGAYGVSFIVAMSNGLLGDLLLQPMFRIDAAGRRRRGPAIMLCLPLWLMVMIINLGYGAGRLFEAPGPDSPSLTVAVIQTNVPQSNKDRGTDEQVRADFDRLVDLTRAAAAEPVDLVVWPETVVPKPINDESVRVFDAVRTDYGDYRRRVVQLARDLGTSILAGAHAMEGWVADEQGVAPDRRYNSAYLIDRTGMLGGRYDKVHRVPYGEYVPFESVPALHRLILSFSPYEGDYSLGAGTDWTRLAVQPRSESGPWLVGTPICFEDVVSYVPRHLVWDDGGKAADLLVNISNDGWFAGTAQAPQHEQIARFRAVENRVPMVRSVNTGVSSVIDSSGRVTARVIDDLGDTQEIDGFVVATVTADPRATLFSRMGDWVAAASLAAASILVILALLRRFLRRAST